MQGDAALTWNDCRATVLHSKRGIKLRSARQVERHLLSVELFVLHSWCQGGPGIALLWGSPTVKH